MPPNALAEPVAIGVAEAALGDLPELPASLRAAGPAIALTPHGTTFDVAITVSLPVHDDPTTAVEVWRLDDDADESWELVEEVTPEAGLATITTDRFSYYVTARVDDGSVCLPAGENCAGAAGLCCAGTTCDGERCVADAADGGAAEDAGAADGGAARSYCTDEPPTVLSSGTGTVLRNGMSWFTVAEAIAEHGVTGDETAGWTSTLRITLTSYPNACGMQQAAQAPEGGQVAWVHIEEHSTTAPPGFPAEGTYGIGGPGAPDPEPTDVPYLRSAWLGLFQFYLSSECSAGGAPKPMGATGSLTITNVTPTLVEGTYRWDCGEFCAEVSGTFSAPLLDCARAPDTSFCCREP
ncbi:MAG: hypothetical protein M3Y87_09085 [Myxococcota bacterium]|nr:hypothetical protein [Myxococcota bacterium]